MYQYELKPKAKVVQQKQKHKLWDDGERARSGKVKECKTAIAVRQM